MGVLIIRSLLFGVCIGVPDCWKLPYVLYHRPLQQWKPWRTPIVILALCMAGFKQHLAEFYRPYHSPQKTHHHSPNQNNDHAIYDPLLPTRTGRESWASRTSDLHARVPLAAEVFLSSRGSSREPRCLSLEMADRSCKYIYTHICRHTYAENEYMHVHIYVHMSIYVCVYTYVRSHVNTYICKNIYMHVCMYACMSVYTHGTPYPNFIKWWMAQDCDPLPGPEH